MSIDEAKHMLGGLISDMSDEEVNNFIIQCTKMASIIVDFAEKEAIK